MNDEHLDKSITLFGDGIGRVELVQHYGTDLTVVNSARVSFGASHSTLTSRDKKLINYLVKHKHTSTLEHCGATFKFVVPLFVRSQHHRHRTWSYNEISRRYTSVNIMFYEPDEFRIQSNDNRQASIGNMTNPYLYLSDTFASNAIKSHHKKALELYNDLINNGVCREQARGVLPQNMYTEYYGTANLNNLLKFISLRLHSGAQWEIQQVAKAVLDLCEELWPMTVGTYHKHVLQANDHE